MSSRMIFIDVGTHTGQTLLLAAKRYQTCDRYIGVEPVPDLYQETCRNIPDTLKSVMDVYNFALDYQSVPEKNVIFYQDIGHTRLGSSLLKDKKNLRVREINVKSVDIRQFFAQFKDYNILLKLDVEGKEYDILEGMIKENLLQNVRELFVEWHWNKVKSISQLRHDNIVAKLNKMGYPLTGISSEDEFYCGL
jgi:FkbM family methyltransferase